MIICSNRASTDHVDTGSAQPDVQGSTRVVVVVGEVVVVGIGAVVVVVDALG